LVFLLCAWFFVSFHLRYVLSCYFLLEVFWVVVRFSRVGYFSSDPLKQFTGARAVNDRNKGKILDFLVSSGFATFAASLNYQLNI